LIGALPQGPLDIVGDVHGEIDALESLLAKLGNDPDRTLVFVGDLVDRGPDSPAVLRRVRDLCDDGRAVCIAGNHELNALRDDPEKRRPGEGWWYGRDEHGARRVDAGEKEREFLPFLDGLPLALERPGLRVVHACWHESIESLRDEPSVLQSFRDHEAKLAPELEDLKQRAWRAFEAAGYTARDLYRKGPRLDLIPDLALLDERKQMGNPVKIATSGMERRVTRPFRASGKWRMVERVPWWGEFAGEPPVVVGHYWRRQDPTRPASDEKLEADVFGDLRAHEWLGDARRVMCIDYSVGRRAEERRAGRAVDFDGCLAALRVPEWQLVFDDGRGTTPVGPPGEQT
jgi:hypothetical protein